MQANRAVHALSPLDFVRQGLNLLLALGMVALVVWSSLNPVAQPADSAQTIPIVTPASLTFLISYVIYAGSLVYAVYQALPAQRADPLLRRSGWFTAAVYLGSILWILAARAHSLWLTVLFILWILAAIVGAYIPTIDRRAPRTAAEHWIVRAHLGVLLGWVTVLTVANIAAALTEAGVTGLWFSDDIWAIGVLGLEAAIVAYVIWASMGDGVFTLTAIWCFGGIVVANIVRDPHPGVALTAGLAATIAAVTWLIRKSTPEAIEQSPPNQPAIQP